MFSLDQVFSVVFFRLGGGQLIGTLAVSLVGALVGACADRGGGLGVDQVLQANQPICKSKCSRLIGNE